MPKPKRKGKLSKIEEGKLLLTNDKGVSFEVNRTTVYVWEKCDGNKKLQDIGAEVTKRLYIKEGLREDAERAVYKTIDQLKEVGLVDLG